MPVSDQTLALARTSNRPAVEAVLTASYPAVSRIAQALTGDANAARRVERFVLRRGVRFMPRWRKTVIPENWFYHHTLLASREAAAHPPPADRDLLIAAGPAREPAYVAFVRALRGLPRQQMEAFVLCHGEKLNARLLGVSMDCSMAAAATHLDAASAALRQLAGTRFSDLTRQLEDAYARLTPPETRVRSEVSRQAGAGIWRARVRRIGRRIVLLALLALLGYAVWRWHPLLLQWLRAVQSGARTQPA